MQVKKIISYNVNGIRAAVGKGFIDWLQEYNPDIVCLQEIKAQSDQLPIMELQAIGYHCFSFSAQKKGYSGVAILTKEKPDKVLVGMQIPAYDSEGRFIRADFGEISVVSVYHPSGTSGDERQAFKMQWLVDFEQYVTELRKTRPKLILGGDYNICNKAIDIHDPIRNANSSGFLPEERAWMDAFLSKGFTDSFRYLHPDTKDAYSWWSYRANARANNKGWRIDYFMTSQNLESQLKSAYILPQIFHSDHCPIGLDIEI
ncbi:MAG: exodeoxyribonuclease III [Bacteroidales bacterium]